MAGRAGGGEELVGPQDNLSGGFFGGGGGATPPLQPRRSRGALRASAFPLRGLGEGQGPLPPLCLRKFSEGGGLSSPCGGYTVP